MASHDHAYKALFSHPEMVRDLLDGFVCGEWLAQLDYASLEKVNSTYVTDDLRGRSDDLVWRVKWREDWIYVYLLLEFQSTVDPSMAVRMLAYVALLYQDLIKSQKLVHGKLPRVLPLVLYNGFVRWYAKDEISALIHAEPRALDAYQPYLRYLLVDERQYRDSDLAPMRNLAAVLFRLERGDTRDAINDALAKLMEWLEGPEQSSLRRAFETWLNRIMLPRYTRVHDDRVRELPEVRAMWAERIREEFRLEHLEEGRREGREQGLEQGLERGLREGEARLLLRLLEVRFGELPTRVRMRVEHAGSAELEHWGERLFSVDSLDALFEDRASSAG
jgi:predicted transposase/invertase (TIGR01784 family)